MPKNKEEILESKRKKMADPGYYVEYLVDEKGEKIFVEKYCTVICIGNQATAKYSRYDTWPEWVSLNWNCSPSRKFMEQKNSRPCAKEGEMCENRFEYYKTWQDFLNQCRLQTTPLSRTTKAPNDDFSP